MSSERSMSSSADSHAKTSVSPEKEKDSDTTMDLLPGVDFSSTSCESPNGPTPGGWSLKMFPAFSVPTKDGTLQSWLEKWLGPKLMFLGTDGETPASRLAPKDSSNGAYWTRNTSEFRNGAVVCSLSEILEIGEIDRRYFLSQKACRGILRRAERRGKGLPPMLRRALEQVAGDLKEPERAEDKTK